MGKYILGLDIGIASVGWGIVDIDNDEIIDAGVRLFSEADVSNNVKRREFRSARRINRRRQQRIIDLKRVLQKEGLISIDFKPLPNPYKIRIKGLSSKLTNEELATCLINIVNRRGLVNDDIVPEEEEIKENETNKKIYSFNKSKLEKENLHVCQIQQAKIEEGKLRASGNMFFTKDYIKEVDKILSNQNLSVETNNKIKEIVERKREYYEGPGSFTSPTSYGRFIKQDGKVVEIDLIEKMRGKCSVYKDELRAPKMSYSAELHDFLNDLNNLTLPNNTKITTEQKKEIINEYINKKGKITPKQ